MDAPYRIAPNPPAPRGRFRWWMLLAALGALVALGLYVEAWLHLPWITALVTWLIVVAPFLSRARQMEKDDRDKAARE